MEAPRALALADDLTGALEVGAKFAQRRLSTIVTTEVHSDLKGVADVVVIDTETRHLPPAEARSRVSALAYAAQAEGVPLIYKKTDSTLRGNIGGELCGIASASPGEPLFYVPAYPEMGRTVRGGHLYVDGIRVSDTEFASDALNPVTSSYIPDIISAQCSVPVFLASIDGIATVTRPGIYVCDGEVEEEVEAAAAALFFRPGVTLAAGPAVLPGYLAAFMSPGPAKTLSLPILARCLVINGSRHELSCRQMRHAEEHGWRKVEPGEIPERISSSGWLLLESGSFAPSSGAIREILREVHIDGLIVFGGDTAYSILQALEAPRLYPLGEVLPGVPIARIELPQGKLYLITKAGGFGPVNVLPLIQQVMLKSGGLK